MSRVCTRSPASVRNRLARGSRSRASSSSARTPARPRAAVEGWGEGGRVLGSESAAGEGELGGEQGVPAGAPDGRPSGRAPEEAVEQRLGVREAQRGQRDRGGVSLPATPVRTSLEKLEAGG